MLHLKLLMSSHQTISHLLTPHHFNLVRFLTASLYFLAFKFLILSVFESFSFKLLNCHTSPNYTTLAKFSILIWVKTVSFLDHSSFFLVVSFTHFLDFLFNLWKLPSIMFKILDFSNCKVCYFLNPFFFLLQ